MHKSGSLLACADRDIALAEGIQNASRGVRGSVLVFLRIATCERLCTTTTLFMTIKNKFSFYFIHF